MKISRKELRLIIESVLKEESESQIEESEKWMITTPKGTKNSKHSVYLKKLLSILISKFLGSENELDSANLIKHLENRDIPVTKLDVGDEAELSSNIPGVKFISAELTMMPGGKSMFVDLDYFLNGERINSSGGPLDGIKKGEDDEAMYGHKSNNQLAQYVEKLLS